MKWFRRLIEWWMNKGVFKPCVIYFPEVRLTQILLHDCFIVWTPLEAGRGHFVDLGYDEEGKLVGVQVWDNVEWHK